MGVGAVAAAAAVAGAVFLYGTDAGKKRRKEIKSWSLKMQADVVDKISAMKEWSEESYHELIDNVAKRYETMKDVNSKELAKLVKDLKAHWRTLRKTVEAKRVK